MLEWLFISFWLLDVFDFSFMEIFDTLIPINGLAWLVIWAPLPLLAACHAVVNGGQKDESKANRIL